MNITEVSGSTIRYNISRSELVSISISFTLQEDSFPADVIKTIKTNTLTALTTDSYLTSVDDIVVLAFQPNCKKLCCSINIMSAM